MLSIRVNDEAVELQLLETLEDLSLKQLKYFQWFLQKEWLLDTCREQTG